MAGVEHVSICRHLGLSVSPMDHEAAGVALVCPFPPLNPQTSSPPGTRPPQPRLERTCLENYGAGSEDEFPVTNHWLPFRPDLAPGQDVS